MGKRSLGRGMEALFNDHNIMQDLDPSQESFKEIALSEIQPNPYQPRRVFSEEEIQELAVTIQNQGLIQPIAVRKHQDHYQIIAGERRYRAFMHLHKETIPCRVFDRLSDKQMMEMALIENIQRVQLSPVEEALAYQQLIQNHDYRHEDLGDILGKSRSAVTNTLRLLKLPPEVQTWIQEGKLSAGHARNLLRAEVSDIMQAAREMIAEPMSVRDAEKKIPATQKKRSPIKDPHTNQIENELRELIGSEVRLVEKNSQGHLEIKFHSLEELNHIRNIIQNGSQF